MIKQSTAFLLLSLSAIPWGVTPAAAQLPQAIEAPGQTVVATFHAIGAQIYECRAGNDGKLAWAGREPTAALLLDGKTIGRHYAGPTWEHMDGSAIVARAAGNAPGKTAADVAWLKLEVTSSRGNGILSPVATVQRINTAGGAHSGACNKAGDLHSVAYETDYVFLKK
jgi:hypothetical protein